MLSSATLCTRNTITYLGLSQWCWCNQVIYVVLPQHCRYWLIFALDPDLLAEIRNANNYLNWEELSQKENKLTPTWSSISVEPFIANATISSRLIHACSVSVTRVYDVIFTFVNIWKKKKQFIIIIIIAILFDSQGKIKGLNRKKIAKQLPDLHSKMPRYCGPVLFFLNNYLKLLLK